MVRYTSLSGDALLQRLLAVDLEKLLRDAREECADQSRRDFRTLRRRSHELLQIVGQELHVLAGAIFEHERKAAGCADAGNRRRREA